ncbi:type 1 fimbrial protein, partial [Providencia manganoxydans]
TLLYNGKNILATSTDGLGIDFKEVTGGTVRPLEMSKKQRIYPERVDETLYRMDLQAQLVNAVPINQLAPGKFTSTVTLSVTYN